MLNPKQSFQEELWKTTIQWEEYLSKQEIQDGFTQFIVAWLNPGHPKLMQRNVQIMIHNLAQLAIEVGKSYSDTILTTPVRHGEEVIIEPRNRRRRTQNNST